jgi:DNA-binding transcriptional LysR family regulator
MSSYHAILGCVSVGMGIALLPRCVLSALPYADAIRIHDLPPGQDRAQTMLIWRKDVRSANVEALASLYRSEETSQQ